MFRDERNKRMPLIVIQGCMKWEGRGGWKGNEIKGFGDGENIRVEKKKKQNLRIFHTSGSSKR